MEFIDRYIQRWYDTYIVVIRLAINCRTTECRPTIYNESIRYCDKPSRDEMTWFLPRFILFFNNFNDALQTSVGIYF